MPRIKKYRPGKSVKWPNGARTAAGHSKQYVYTAKKGAKKTGRTRIPGPKGFRP